MTCRHVSGTYIATAASSHWAIRCSKHSDRSAANDIEPSAFLRGQSACLDCSSWGGWRPRRCLAHTADSDAGSTQLASTSAPQQQTVPDIAGSAVATAAASASSAHGKHVRKHAQPAPERKASSMPSQQMAGAQQMGGLVPAKSFAAVKAKVAPATKARRRAHLATTTAAASKPRRGSGKASYQTSCKAGG